jgi:hypothetical protein
MLLVKTFLPFLLITSLLATACGSARRAKQVAGPTQAERFDPTTRSWVPADATMVRPATLPTSTLAAEKSAEGVKIIDSVDPAARPQPATAAAAAPQEDSSTLKKVSRGATAPLRWIGLGKKDDA